MSSELEKENKTLLSKEELNKAINKLTQFLDVDEEEEQDDLPEYLRQKNNQEDYVEEPLVIDNLKDIAREIAELALQNEELTKRIMKHQKNKQKKVHSYDITVKRLYELNHFQQNKRAEMQFQLFQKEVQELTWTPQISEASRKMAEAKYNNVPLHMRINQCLEEKKRNIEKVKFQISLAQKKNETSFEKPNDNFSFKQGNLSEGKRGLKKEDVEKSWSKIKTWYADRNDYITKGQFAKLEKEVKDLTLKPKINESSRKILEKKNTEKEPVEDRLIKRYINKMEEKRVKSESEHRNNNSPFISKHSKKLAEKHAARTASSSSGFVYETPKTEKVKKNLFKGEVKTFDVKYSPEYDFLIEKVGTSKKK